MMCREPCSTEGQEQTEWKVTVCDSKNAIPGAVGCAVLQIFVMKIVMGFTLIKLAL
jgi:hypothetical protein